MADDVRPRGSCRVEERDDVAGALERLSRIGPVMDPDAPPPDGPRIWVAFFDSYRETGLFGAEVCHRLGIRAVFFPIFEPPLPGEEILSDDAIVSRLKAADIDIARRTVAKYRESLRIPSSVERRREKAVLALAGR